MTALAARLIVALLASLLSVLTAEAVVRLVMPQAGLLIAPGLYVFDEVLGYRHQPGYHGFFTNVVEYTTRVQINALGFRGTAPQDGPTRILVLGDSFVFGQGVEAAQSVSGRVETWLRGRQRYVDVLNAGVRGFGVAQEAELLGQVAAQLRPDLIVFGVFLGNDLENDTAIISAHDRFFSFAPPRSWHTPLTGPLYSWSHVYRATRTGWVRLSVADGQVPWLRANYGATGPGDRYHATERALDRAVAIARELDAALFAFLIPDPIQVEPSGQRAFADAAHAHPELRLDLHHPNRVFSALFSKRRIGWLDLTPAFQARTRDGEVLYFPIDRHWNAAGHQAASELLGPAIDALIR